MSNPILGQSITLQATFSDSDGNPVDPTVTLIIRDPTGTMTTPVVTNPSLGVFQHELDLTIAGIWRWRWEGDSLEGTIVCEDSICADASVMAGVT